MYWVEVLLTVWTDCIMTCISEVFVENPKSERVERGICLSVRQEVEAKHRGLLVPMLYICYVFSVVIQRNCFTKYPFIR